MVSLCLQERLIPLQVSPGCQQCCLTSAMFGIHVKSHQRKPTCKMTSMASVGHIETRVRNCVSEHKSPLLGQEQLVAGQHCSKVEVWEHDHQRKYHIVPHDAWRRFVFHYVQDGRYVRKMAYLKRHITSRGRLYMILTIISEKL